MAHSESEISLNSLSSRMLMEWGYLMRRWQTQASDWGQLVPMNSDSFGIVVNHDGLDVTYGRRYFRLALGIFETFALEGASNWIDELRDVVSRIESHDMATSLQAQIDRNTYVESLNKAVAVESAVRNQEGQWLDNKGKLPTTAHEIRERNLARNARLPLVESTKLEVNEFFIQEMFSRGFGNPNIRIADTYGNADRLVIEAS